MVGLVGCYLLDAFCELVVGGEEIEGGGDGGVVGGYGVGEGVEGGFEAVEAGLEENVHFWVIIGRSKLEVPELNVNGWLPVFVTCEPLHVLLHSSNRKLFSSISQ